MSYVARRALSTLIPPKIASPNVIGGAKDSARMAQMVDFYKNLPRGSAPAAKPKGLFGWYHEKYFKSGNESAMPIVHLIGFLLAVGYAQAYYFHLRHHKNNAH